MTVISAPPGAVEPADSVRFETALSLAGPRPELGEVLDAAPTPDGGLVVLDASGPEVLVFDSLGRLAGRFGREGGGPGELRARGLTGVVVDDGGVLVPDLASGRATRFSRDGAFRGSFAIPIEDGLPLDWATHPGGGFVYRRAGARHELVRVDTAGRPVGPATPLASDTPDSGPGPLGPLPVWCLFPDGALASGGTHAYEVRIADETGSIRTIARGPTAATPLDEADRTHLAALLEESLRRRSGGTADPAVLAAMLESVPFPETRPVIAGLRCQTGGTLWIQRAAAVTDMGEDALRVGSTIGYGAPVWDVVDLSTGAHRIAVLPRGSRLTRLDGSLLTVVLTDALGIQSVERLKAR